MIDLKKDWEISRRRWKSENKNRVKTKSVLSDGKVKRILEIIQFVDGWDAGQ